MMPCVWLGEDIKSGQEESSVLVAIFHRHRMCLGGMENLDTEVLNRLIVGITSIRQDDDRAFDLLIKTEKRPMTAGGASVERSIRLRRGDISTRAIPSRRLRRRVGPGVHGFFP